MSIDEVADANDALDAWYEAHEGSSAAQDLIPALPKRR